MRIYNMNMKYKYNIYNMNMKYKYNKYKSKYMKNILQNGSGLLTISGQTLTEITSEDTFKLYLEKLLEEFEPIINIIMFKIIDDEGNIIKSGYYYDNNIYYTNDKYTNISIEHMINIYDDINFTIVIDNIDSYISTIIEKFTNYKLNDTFYRYRYSDMQLLNGDIVKYSKILVDELTPIFIDLYKTLHRYIKYENESSDLYETMSHKQFRDRFLDSVESYAAMVDGIYTNVLNYMKNY